MVSELFSIDQSISNFGEETGKPIDELFVHRDSKLEDNKVKEELLGDYVPIEIRVGGSRYHRPRTSFPEATTTLY